MVSLIPGRRRRSDNAGEPLFGEDWWVADQKLFEVARRRRSVEYLA
jgi:hypothetical protein